jgi:hypothetical protein
MSEDIRTQFFPMSLPTGVVGHWVDRTMVATEIQELNAQIFRPHELQLFQVPAERQPGVHRLQQSYTPSHPECVVFYSETRLPVGWFYSYREDAATTFIDTVGFLPAYRGRGLYTAFLPKYLAYAILAWYAQAQSCAGPTAVNLSTPIG